MVNDSLLIVLSVVRDSDLRIWSPFAVVLILTIMSGSAAAAPPDGVDCSTLSRKVMCGYQGWFNCPGDGSGLGWNHWSRHRHRDLFGPGNARIDLWPDVTELDADERFDTEFRRADGATAEVFSSAHPKTVARHFRWMRDYGIDGAFIQRFSSGLHQANRRRHKDRVLTHARQGAERFGRAFAVMYDLSGMQTGTLDQVRDDWRGLRSKQKITCSPAYLHHHGKPLLALWGVGFIDRHKGNQYTLDDCRKLTVDLRASGCSIMLGVPTGWRELNRDAVDDSQLLEITQMADVISPWTPGRYCTPQDVRRHANASWLPDRRWCNSRGQDYLPVVFPGFSWHHLRNGESELDQIPRLGGQFLWSQIVAAKHIGADMIYVAMFDEMDEGTAIFKCTNEPPVGEDFRFLTYEGFPSDHYLRIAGSAGKILRDELPATDTLPQMDPVSKPITDS